MRSRGFVYGTVLFVFLSAGVTGNVIAQNAPSDHFREGYELLQRYDTQRAIERFEQGLKIEPTNALAHFYLGEALSLSARTEEAREHYEQSLKLDSNSDVAELARKKLQANAAPTKKPASTQDAQDGSVTIPPLSCQITTCRCDTKYKDEVVSCNMEPPCADILDLSQGPAIIGRRNKPERYKYSAATVMESQKGVCEANELTVWATEATIEARYEYRCSCDKSKGCTSFFLERSGRGRETISRTSGVITVDRFDQYATRNVNRGTDDYTETTQSGQGQCTTATPENRKF